MEIGAGARDRAFRESTFDVAKRAMLTSPAGCARRRNTRMRAKEFAAAECFVR